MPVGNFGHHGRTEYDRRLRTTDFAATPRVWIEISGGRTGGENRLHWVSAVEGPCDWVGLFRTGGQLTSAANPIRSRFVTLDGNNVHTTTVSKGDNYWAGYVNMFGQLITSREYFPTTPSVSLRRNDNCCSPDTIDFVWSVSDPGQRDLIVLFDRDPRIAGPDGYYRSIVGRVEANAKTNSPERTAIWVGRDPNKWWVAYIMRDDNGNQRILAVSRGVRG